MRESIHRWARGALDRAIVALAARQHGVVSLAQLLALGLSERAVHARIAAGRLHRIHQGVYAVGRPDVTIMGKVDAWETHGTRRAFRNDRRRDRVLRAHGWDPVRVTGYDVKYDADDLISEIRALLERARSRTMDG